MKKNTANISYNFDKIKICKNMQKSAKYEKLAKYCTLN